MNCCIDLDLAHTSAASCGILRNSIKIRQLEASRVHPQYNSLGVMLIMKIFIDREKAFDK